MAVMLCLVLLLALSNVAAISANNYLKAENAKLQIALMQEQRLDVIMDRLSFYESSHRTHVWGDLDLKYPVYGRYQYQHRTFIYLCKMA